MALRIYKAILSLQNKVCKFIIITMASSLEAKHPIPLCGFEMEERGSTSPVADFFFIGPASSRDRTLVTYNNRLKIPGSTPGGSFFYDRRAGQVKNLLSRLEGSRYRILVRSFFFEKNQNR